MELIQNGRWNFQPSSPRCVLYPTYPFPFYYPLSTPLTVFLFEFVPAIKNSSSIYCWYVSIFKLGICCYPDLDLPINFSLIAFLSLSLSVYLSLPWLSFSCMFLFLPPSCGCPINLAWKQLGINQSPICKFFFTWGLYKKKHLNQHLYLY